MPYYSRYRRRYPSRYRRRIGYRRRYYRRRSSGGSVSSRSRTRVRVPTQTVVTLTIAAGTTDSDVLTSSPWIGGTVDSPHCVASAVQTQLYRNYCNLFDQVKCDGVVSKISLVTNIGGSSGLQALTIVSTYDRMGTEAEALVGLTFDKLMNSSNVVIRNAVNNSVAKTARSCWASDIQERTVFHDCTISKKSQMTDGYFDEDFHSNLSKVGYFSPMLNLGVRLPAASPTAATTVTLLLEQTYYFTFRNPKFGVTGVSTQSASRALRAIDAADALDEEDEEVPQALIDMTARAADDTGRMVRAHPTSGLTPDKKRQRTAMADLAERFERESEELQKRYEDHDAQVSKRFGTTDISRYPRSDRDLLEKMYNASGRRAQLAESLRRDVRDLDHEYPEVPAATAAAADLDHTDTLPLDN